MNRKKAKTFAKTPQLGTYYISGDYSLMHDLGLEDYEELKDQKGKDTRGKEIEIPYLKRMSSLTKAIRTVKRARELGKQVEVWHQLGSFFLFRKMSEARLRELLSDKDSSSPADEVPDKSEEGKKKVVASLKTNPTITTATSLLEKQLAKSPGNVGCHR